MASRRALHFVLKIGDRPAMIDFLKNTLGMKVLRHEEFEEGCEATCNGPYQNKWSKTMIGYGPESCHFVLELTYNYPVDKYRLGNDILGITVGAPGDLMEKIRSKLDWKSETDQKLSYVSPAGYKFYLENDESLRIKEVALSTSSLTKTLGFWQDLLEMQVVSKDANEVVLNYDVKSQTNLRFVISANGVDHATAFGRIAFSIPTPDLPPLEAKIKEASLGTVKTPLVVLPTPGKADVQVVILEDHDNHEICFVGAEGFDDLSQVDPKGDALLEEALEADKSKEWYEKKKRSKDEAK